MECPISGRCEGLRNSDRFFVWTIPTRYLNLGCAPSGGRSVTFVQWLEMRGRLTDFGWVVLGASPVDDARITTALEQLLGSSGTKVVTGQVSVHCYAQRFAEVGAGPHQRSGSQLFEQHLLRVAQTCRCYLATFVLQAVKPTGPSPESRLGGRWRGLVEG